MTSKSEEIIEFFNKKAPIEKLTVNFFGKNFTFSMLREDALHPSISGNKFRKLKYPLLKCVNENYQGIVTMGGAYSNHIDATAYAGEYFKIPITILVRGEEPKNPSPTLVRARKRGAQLIFISRSEYRTIREDGLSTSFKKQFENYLFLPEGGASKEGMLGCTEMVDGRFSEFDTIVVAAGTGSTAAGILNVLNPEQQLLVFPVLKGDFMENDILKMSEDFSSKLIVEHNKAHFGGYAKTTPDLFKIINAFYKQTGIPLDPIYNGKALSAMLEMMLENLDFTQQKILYIHTGGLQGAESFKELVY